MFAAARQHPWLVRIRRAGPTSAPDGAGFLVGDRLILTCAHVVRPASLEEIGDVFADDVWIDFPELSSEPQRASVLREGWVPMAEDGRGDIAILELADDSPPGASRPPLRYARNTRGHMILAYGFPAGQYFSSAVPAHGVLSVFGGPGFEWVEIERAMGRFIESGYSGSPVWDENVNAVVGMVVAQDRSRNAATAYMIPLEVLAKVWPPLANLCGSPLLFDPALQTYWGPRARGVQQDSEPGWYFTGRTKLLRELVSWLTVAPDASRRSRVLTGSPGSGKTSVIARLVTLSDAQYRSTVSARFNVNLDTDEPMGTIPPESSIDIAIYAGGRSMSELVDTIAAAAGVEADEPNLLIDSLIKRRQPLTIAIDPLSEVEEPQTIARKLLRPLADYGSNVGIRLLVGTTPELLRALGSSWDVFDLDDPTYLESEDLADYVKRILLDPARRSPYEGRTELAAAVAKAVADRALPSFLIARLVALDLLHRKRLIDTHVAGWTAQFPDSVTDAMEDYLASFGREQRKARHLLTPLAWAKGAGLPAGAIWAAVASRLANTTYDGNDIDWLLDHGAAFLIKTEHSSGAPTYRLFHGAMAKYLRSEYGPEIIQPAFVKGILDTVPNVDGTREWETSPEYVKKHLVSHAMEAASAGEPAVLDELLIDPLFLLVADPHRILRALPAAKSKLANQAAHAFGLASHHLLTESPSVRCAYLQLGARLANANELANRIENLRLEQPWGVLWAKGTLAHPQYVVGTHNEAIHVVVVGALEGRPIVVSGGDDRSVRVWDLADGTPLYDQLIGHVDSVYALALGMLDNRQVILSGSHDRDIRFWDLATGDTRPERLHVDQGSINAVAITALGGHTIILAGVDDGSVRMWSDKDGFFTSSVLGYHSDSVYSLAVGEYQGRKIVASSGRDGYVHVWDLVTGERVARLVGDYPESVNAVATCCLNRRLVIVAGLDGGSLRRWDLEKGVPIGPAIKGHTGSVWALAQGILEDRPVIISCSRDRYVKAWDLMSGDLIGQPLANPAPLNAVALGNVQGRPVIVSAGDDRTVRVSNAPAASFHHLADSDASANAVALATIRQRDVAVAAGEDGVIRVFDLATGNAISPPYRGHDGPVHALAVVAPPRSNHLVVSGGADRRLHVWDLVTGRQVEHDHPAEHADAVKALVVAERDGHYVIVSGGDDGTVRIWDLMAGTPMGVPLTDHRGPVNTLAIGHVKGSPAIISGGDDGTIRVWDLVSVTPMGLPITGYARRIYAVSTGQINGRSIVVAGGSHPKVQAWDLDTKVPISKPLDGHEGQVNAVAVGAIRNEPVIVSSDEHGGVYVWRLSRPSRLTIDIGFGVYAVALGKDSIGAIGGSQQLVAVRLDLSA